MGHSGSALATAQTTTVAVKATSSASLPKQKPISTRATTPAGIELRRLTCGTLLTRDLPRDGACSPPEVRQSVQRPRSVCTGAAAVSIVLANAPAGSITSAYKRFVVRD